jgi:hypothetical protein
MEAQMFFCGLVSIRKDWSMSNSDDAGFVVRHFKDASQPVRQRIGTWDRQSLFITFHHFFGEYPAP